MELAPTSITRYARRAWTAYWKRRAEEATLAVLHALDDRALKDFGLDRSEVESVVLRGGEERRIRVGWVEFPCARSAQYGS